MFNSIIHHITFIKGIEYKNEDLISVRIRALNSGRVTVTASVSLADGSKLPPARVEVIGECAIEKFES